MELDGAGPIAGLQPATSGQWCAAERMGNAAGQQVHEHQRIHARDDIANRPARVPRAVRKRMHDPDRKASARRERAAGDGSPPRARTDSGKKSISGGTAPMRTRPRRLKTSDSTPGTPRKGRPSPLLSARSSGGASQGPTGERPPSKRGGNLRTRALGRATRVLDEAQHIKDAESATGAGGDDDGSRVGQGGSAPQQARPNNGSAVVDVDRRGKGEVRRRQAAPTSPGGDTAGSSHRTVERNPASRHLSPRAPLEHGARERRRPPPLSHAQPTSRANGEAGTEGKADGIVGAASEVRTPTRGQRVTPGEMARRKAQHQRRLAESRRKEDSGASDAAIKPDRVLASTTPDGLIASGAAAAALVSDDSGSDSDGAIDDTIVYGEPRGLTAAALVAEGLETAGLSRAVDGGPVRPRPSGNPPHSSQLETGKMSKSSSASAVGGARLENPIATIGATASPILAWRDKARQRLQQRKNAAGDAAVGPRASGSQGKVPLAGAAGGAGGDGGAGSDANVNDGHNGAKTISSEGKKAPGPVKEATQVVRAPAIAAATSAVTPALRAWRQRARHDIEARKEVERLRVDRAEAESTAVSDEDTGDAADALSNEARPLPPKVISATGSSITVRWHVVRPDASRFELQYRPKGAQHWRVVSRGIFLREFTMRNLPPGRVFFVRVRARYGDAWSKFSAPSAPLQTVQLRPAKPGRTRCSAATLNSVRVSWEPPDDHGSPINLYTLLCGRASASPDAEVEMHVIYSGPHTFCVAMHLQPDTRYVFRLIASNGFGDSDVSDPSFGSTTTPPTDVPLRIVRDWSEWWDSSSRRSYFVNNRTNERRWDLPATLNMALRSFGEWTEYWDETSQHVFYVNSRTQERRWEPPVDLDALVEAELRRAEELNKQLEEDEDEEDDDDANEVKDAAEEGEPASSGGAGESSDVAQEGEAATTDGEGPSRSGGIGSGDAAAPADSEARRHKVTATGKVTRKDVEFRKKRFKLLWSARIANVRPGSVNLEVRRRHVLADSLSAFRRFSPTELQQKLVVIFADEEGIDSGGLTKDWCLLLSRKALSQRARLFAASSAGFYDVLPTAACRPASRKSLRLLGRFLGKAVFDRQLVDMPLSAATCRAILCEEVTFEDLLETDPELHRGLNWALENDVTDILEADFSVSVPKEQAEAYHATDEGAMKPRKVGVGGAGVTSEGDEDDWETFEVTAGVGADAGGSAGKGGEESVKLSDLVQIDLVSGGRDMEVTEENKTEYVKRMAWWRCYGQCKAGLEAFAAGVHEMLPPHALKGFSVQELRELLNGKNDINLAAMRRTSNFTGGLDKRSDRVRWLWRSLTTFSQQERAAFLKFATGTSRVPLDGFDPPFTVTAGDDMAPTALPRAHTCFSQVVIPPYPSYEVLREKLLYAIHNSDSFTLS